MRERSIEFPGRNDVDEHVTDDGGGVPDRPLGALCLARDPGDELVGRKRRGVG
ncbi:hypothetical protein OB919_01520 [Halobacteria archaeon AArc-curdl1]|uniref:Uncharacterized protein n=1 Tax=Natronosalvus hydrolyticus TaxID=2979988 RepID=A0AAP3E5R6_9EURY|nr:hypothetical protein [Halobacteria archaeon AArc-curdl1]